MRYFFLVFVVFFNFISPVYACDLCAVYNFIETRSGVKGSLNTGVSYRMTHYESNVRPQGLESFPGQHLDSNIMQVYSGYNFSEELAVQANLPLIYRDYRRIIGTRVKNGSESGVGDISLLLRWAPFRNHEEHSSYRFDFFTGLKLPTGESDPLREEREAFLGDIARHSSVDGSLVGGDDIALGSGSYDFLFGGSAFYQFNRYYLQGSLQYSLRQEGDYDFEYGDDLLWELGIGYYWLLEHEDTVSTRLKVSGEHKQKDEVIGLEIADSDFDATFVGLELAYSKSSLWFFSLAGDLPVSTEDSASQVTPRYRFFLNATRKFSL